VRPSQYNFAGLGASGGGAHGESFADVSTGVKAHLQHLLMYAGEHIDNPVAERTRKVQEWGVLTDWQKSIDGPMTYTLVAKQWAPTSRNYVRDVSAITDGFYNEFCNGDDPNPGLVQEARQGRQPKTTTAKVKKAKAETEVAAVAEPAIEEQPAADTAPKGAEIAKQRVEEERKESPPLKALGAGMLGSIGASAAEAKTPAEDAPPVTLLNAKPEAEQATAEAVTPETKAPAAKPDTKAKSKPDTKAVAKAEAKTKPDAKAEAKGAEVQTASISSAATQLKVPTAKGNGKCKVWTASYGGQRAVIIKANGSGTVNYTVLDVTESNEKREVDAYIAAYAKGGEKLASFPTQTKALNKAFELCPEG
jgi:chemotaxis protein histidine kinase CheA